MTDVVHTDTVKYVRALVWAKGEKLQQDMRNYKEWRLKIHEWLDFNGLWCVIEPVKPEQVEQEPPTPKEKPGRPVGSKSKEPGKPRAKRKIVERPAESDEPENIEIPRALPGSRPIPSEAHDSTSAQMLRLLTAHTKQRQREKTELYKSWFR